MVIKLRAFVAAAFLLFWCGPPALLTGAQAGQAAIQHYSQEAERAMAAKDLSAAAAALERLAALTPDVAEVHANLGMVYYAQNRFSEAEQAFARAVKLDPAIPNGTLMLGLCDAELGHWERARPSLESAFRHPPNPEIGRTVGIKLLEVYSSLGESFKALETAEELLERYPKDPEILYRASHLYGDRALQIMNRLVDVAPQSPWKLMAFAEALEAQKHYDLAIIQYRRVIAADPAIPGVYYRLGRALLLDGGDSEQARDRALKEFQEALARDPRNAGAEYEMGEIYRRRGDREQAARHFFRAVEIDPGFEEAQIAVARMLISLQKPKEALPHLRLAIKVDPANEVSHFLLARAYKSLGNPSDAQREMALYQECHLRSLRGASAGDHQMPTAPSTPPVVTKQTLDPGSHP